jgi:hypothetical protein
MSSSPIVALPPHGPVRSIAPVTGREQPGLLAVAGVPDPRDPRGVRYPLSSVLAVAVCAVLAGAVTFSDRGLGQGSGFFSVGEAGISPAGSRWRAQSGGCAGLARRCWTARLGQAMWLAERGAAPLTPNGIKIHPKRLGAAAGVPDLRAPVED